MKNMVKLIPQDITDPRVACDRDIRSMLADVIDHLGLEIWFQDDSGVVGTRLFLAKPETIEKTKDTETKYGGD